jgi:hypothetical protein
LPSESEERDEPGRADEEIEAAVRAAIVILCPSEEDKKPWSIDASK